MIPAPPPEFPHWMPFVNVSGQVIPGGAVVEPAGGYDSAGRMLVRQCTVSNSYAIYFASPMGCDADSGGEEVDQKPGGVCRPAWPMTAAAVAPADLASYAYPVSAGSKAGDWYLRLGQTGFKFVDPLMDGLANAIPTPTAPVVPASGSGTSGSGGGSGGSTGTFIGYVYRDICTNGILQQWRAEIWSDHMTSYVYLMDNGCCSCSSSGGGSSSSNSGSSGSGGTPQGGTATCCSRTLSATIYAVISGGIGTNALTWDGSNWVSANLSPACLGGGTLKFKYTTGCSLFYSTNNGVSYLPVTNISGTITCGPPFAHTGYTLSPGGSCGALSITIGE